LKDITKKTRRGTRVNNGWLVFNEDGSYEYDLDKHLYYVAKYTTLKPAPAFSNKGLFVTHMNEDSLFGIADVPYCPFNEYSWNNDKEINGVGKDETLLTWDEYLLALEEGNFDMYYGEVKLRNNFDITELLDVDSELNFSRSRDTAYVQYIENYLASSDAQRSAIFKQLCDYINNTGALISLGFESQQLIVHRGVIKGLDANIGNPLYGFENWEIMID
jgi:hypothetical protein